MPARLTPLITNHYYHAFNRGINRQNIFQQKRDYARAKDTLWYYSFENPPLRLSKYLLLNQDQRRNLTQELSNHPNKLVTVISYCLMPNHFHLLLRQEKENGISRFLSKFQNSYTRYCNTKYHYIGPLLQGQFKAVRIEDEFQLVHVSRYIHLNPYTGYVVKNKENILTYPWSSVEEYISSNTKRICDTKIVLTEFQKLSYKEFLLDQADYQRLLGKIKHLTLEEY